MNQLPRQVKIFERIVNLEILEQNLYDSIPVYGDSFFTDVFTNANTNAQMRAQDVYCFYIVMQLLYLDI